MLAVNFLIMVLTGARAPLAYARGGHGLTLAFLGSNAFPKRCRLLPLMLAACLLPFAGRARVPNSRTSVCSMF